MGCPSCIMLIEMVDVMPADFSIKTDLVRSIDPSHEPSRS